MTSTFDEMSDFDRMLAHLRRPEAKRLALAGTRPASKRTGKRSGRSLYFTTALTGAAVAVCCGQAEAATASVATSQAAAGPQTPTVIPTELSTQTSGTAAVPGTAATPAATATTPATTPAPMPAAARNFTLRLSGPSLAHASVEQHGQDIILRFIQPVDDKLRAFLEAQAGSQWIDNVQLGYDSALLHATAPLDISVFRDPTHLVVSGKPMTPQLYAAAGTPQAATGAQAGVLPGDDQSAAARRLDIVKARAQAATGHVADARAELIVMNKDQPSDPEAALALGNIDAAAGMWRSAQHYYEDAAQAEPSNIEAQTGLKTISRETATRLRLDIDTTFETNSTLVDTALSGWEKGPDGWREGARIDSGYGEINGQNQGGPDLNEHAWHWSGEAFVQKDTLAGESFTGTVFSGTHALGGIGGQWSVIHDNGTSALFGEWRKPNWDFIEGFLGDATRDRVGVSRRQNFGDIVAEISTSVERYMLSGHEAARSAAVTADVRFPQNWLYPNLSLVYGLDAEYPWHVSTVDQDGSPVHPLPDEHREIHSLVLDLSQQIFTHSTIDHSLVFEPEAGGGVDRFGRAGPILGANLTWDQGPWQAQLRAGQVWNIAREGGSVTTIGATLMRLFE